MASMNALPFRIKICGIVHPDDARLAADAGADGVGLNFYPRSTRGISIEQARAIAAALPSGVVRVGVFVNALVPQVRAAFAEVPLDLVQLHGDEPPEIVAALSDLPLIRAFRCRSGDLNEAVDYLARCQRLGAQVQGALVDAHQPGTYGGTGRTLDWPALAASRAALGELPLILAGGLTGENVAAAIAAVRPEAVDTASGVENGAGRKDPEKVRQFVAAAREAFDAG